MVDRVTSHTQDIANLNSRVTALETRVALAERDIESINKKLDKIEGNTSKLLWIVVVAIVGAVLRLVITG